MKNIILELLKHDKLFKFLIKIIIEYLCIRVIQFFMANFLFIEYIYIFLVLLFNNKKPLKIYLFLNKSKNKKYFKLYVRILL